MEEYDGVFPPVEERPPLPIEAAHEVSKEEVILGVGLVILVIVVTIVIALFCK